MIKRWDLLLPPAWHQNAFASETKKNRLRGKVGERRLSCVVGNVGT